MFEHLRLDEIPSKHILQRYTKNPVKDPNFNRRDYRATTPSGTSLEYRRTILYNEAMKTVGKGCSSDEMFDMALVAFKELNSRMEVVEDEMNSKKLQKSSEEGSTASAASGDVPLKESTDRYAGIQPPLVAKTKGSRSSDSPHNKYKKGKASAPARPLPKLDEYGKPKGQRLCGNCNTIAGHNARTCERRQMAAKLM